MCRGMDASSILSADSCWFETAAHLSGITIEDDLRLVDLGPDHSTSSDKPSSSVLNIASQVDLHRRQSDRRDPPTPIEQSESPFQTEYLTSEQNGLVDDW
jgi:hypothetical protein